jgi:UDP-N-acetylmuramate: L-alanyl-gamma-D-glutamyl-meso-diaminopimelate ligase
VEKIHLIGICGTGMGSLAGMLKESGYTVRGSDTGAYPPMSTWLEERGIDIMEGYLPGHLDWAPDLVVVGNVCRRDNPESVAAAETGIVCLSFPEVIRLFFLEGKTPLVVTGTHGKTTTSSLLAWILYSAGLDPGFMIGGITGNFDSNFRLGGGDYFVVEGDEYDSAWFDKVPKYWHYAPRFATINNIEFDHGDIYPNIDEIFDVFSKFAALLPADGALWANGDDDRALAAAACAACPVRTFGLGEDNYLRATRIDHTPDGIVVALLLAGENIGEFRLPMPGEHNARNLMGAVAMALQAGVSLETIREALPGFLSVKKRQEVKGRAAGVLVYDDFAHHPTAVRETLAALKARHPDQQLWAIFEAKSNTSRMSVFQDDWPPAFASANRVVLSSPWKTDAHLDNADRIDLNRVASEIRSLGVPTQMIPSVPDIVEYLAGELTSGDVVVGLSGSNFAGFHDALLTRLREPR